MREDLTISASSFKATCLDLLDQIANRKLARLTITKRGRPVAVLLPPDAPGTSATLHGFMRGSVVVPADLDLTAPVLDETLNAEADRLHE